MVEIKKLVANGIKIQSLAEEAALEKLKN